MVRKKQVRVAKNFEDLVRDLRAEMKKKAKINLTETDATGIIADGMREFINLKDLKVVIVKKRKKRKKLLLDFSPEKI